MFIYEIQCRIILVLNSGLSPLRPGSDPGPVQVRSVVDTVALGLGFLYSTLRFYPPTVIPLLLYIHLHLNTHINRRTRGKMMATFKQKDTLSDMREKWIEMKLHIVLFRVQDVWEFLSKYFGFPLPVSIHQYSVFIFKVSLNTRANGDA
jgi:hypothetical protein